MNSDQLKGNCRQIVGKAKETGRQLSEEDWKDNDGTSDQLGGRIKGR